MSVLVLVLDWTQCLPQGADAPPAMLRSRMTGFQNKMGGRASGEVGIICTVPPLRLRHTNHAHAVSVWCTAL